MINKEVIGEALSVVNKDQHRQIRIGRIQTEVIGHGVFDSYSKAASKIKGFEVKVIAGSDQDILTQGRSLFVRESVGKNNVPRLERRYEVLTIHVPEGKFGISIERPIGKSFKDFHQSLATVRKEPEVRKFRR